VRPQEGGKIVSQTVFEGGWKVVPGFDYPEEEGGSPKSKVCWGWLQPGVASVVAPEISPLGDDTSAGVNVDFGA
jgi:hypothetical protein